MWFLLYSSVYQKSKVPFSIDCPKYIPKELAQPFQSDEGEGSWVLIYNMDKCLSLFVF